MSILSKTAITQKIIQKELFLQEHSYSQIILISQPPSIHTQITLKHYHS